MLKIISTRFDSYWLIFCNINQILTCFYFNYLFFYEFPEFLTKCMGEKKKIKILCLFIINLSQSYITEAF